MKTRRLLSMLLAMVMVVSSLPITMATVSAADAGTAIDAAANITGSGAVTADAQGFTSGYLSIANRADAYDALQYVFEFKYNTPYTVSFNAMASVESANNFYLTMGYPGADTPYEYGNAIKLPGTQQQPSVTFTTPANTSGDGAETFTGVFAIWTKYESGKDRNQPFDIDEFIIKEGSTQILRYNFKEYGENNQPVAASVADGYTAGYFKTGRTTDIESSATSAYLVMSSNADYKYTKIAGVDGTATTASIGFTSDTVTELAAGKYAVSALLRHHYSKTAEPAYVGATNIEATVMNGENVATAAETTYVVDGWTNFEIEFELEAATALSDISVELVSTGTEDDSANANKALDIKNVELVLVEEYVETEPEETEPEETEPEETEPEETEPEETEPEETEPEETEPEETEPEETEPEETEPEETEPEETEPEDVFAADITGSGEVTMNMTNTQFGHLSVAGRVDNEDAVQYVYNFKYGTTYKVTLDIRTSMQYNNKSYFTVGYPSNTAVDEYLTFNYQNGIKNLWHEDTTADVVAQPVVTFTTPAKPEGAEGDTFEGVIAIWTTEADGKVRVQPFLVDNFVLYETIDGAETRLFRYNFKDSGDAVDVVEGCEPGYFTTGRTTEMNSDSTARLCVNVNGNTAFATVAGNGTSATTASLGFTSETVKALSAGKYIISAKLRHHYTESQKAEAYIGATNIDATVMNGLVAVTGTETTYVDDGWTDFEIEFDLTAATALSDIYVELVSTGIEEYPNATYTVDNAFRSFDIKDAEIVLVEEYEETVVAPLAGATLIPVEEAGNHYLYIKYKNWNAHEGVKITITPKEGVTQYYIAASKRVSNMAVDVADGSSTRLLALENCTVNDSYSGRATATWTSVKDNLCLTTTDTTAPLSAQITIDTNSETEEFGNVLELDNLRVYYYEDGVATNLAYFDFEDGLTEKDGVTLTAYDKSLISDTVAFNYPNDNAGGANEIEIREEKQYHRVADLNDDGAGAIILDDYYDGEGFYTLSGEFRMPYFDNNGRYTGGGRYIYNEGVQVATVTIWNDGANVGSFTINPYWNDVVVEDIVVKSADDELVLTIDSGVSDDTAYANAIDILNFNFEWAGEINEDELAAKEVEALIGAIGEVTRDDAEAIETARGAYDALTAEQKAYVSEDAVAALEAAEYALQLLEIGTPVSGAELIEPENNGNKYLYVTGKDYNTYEEGILITFAPVADVTEYYVTMARRYSNIDSNEVNGNGLSVRCAPVAGCELSSGNYGRAYNTWCNGKIDGTVSTVSKLTVTPSEGANEIQFYIAYDSSVGNGLDLDNLRIYYNDAEGVETNLAYFDFEDDELTKNGVTITAHNDAINGDPDSVKIAVREEQPYLRVADLTEEGANVIALDDALEAGVYTLSGEFRMPYFQNTGAEGKKYYNEGVHAATVTVYNNGVKYGSFTMSPYWNVDSIEGIIIDDPATANLTLVIDSGITDETAYANAIDIIDFALERTGDVPDYTEDVTVKVAIDANAVDVADGITAKIYAAVESGYTNLSSVQFTLDYPEVLTLNEITVNEAICGDTSVVNVDNATVAWFYNPANGAAIVVDGQVLIATATFDVAVEATTEVTVGIVAESAAYTLVGAEAISKTAATRPDTVIVNVEGTEEPEPEVYTVTIEANENGSVDVATIEGVAADTEITVVGNTITIGETVVTATASGEFYVFDAWSVKNGDTVDSDMTITATFVFDQAAADAAAAAAVDAKIAAIGEVTLEKEDAIVAAREAYNALTADQQALVKNLEVLEAAEETLAEFKTPVVNIEYTAMEVSFDAELLLWTYFIIPDEFLNDDDAYVLVTRDAKDGIKSKIVTTAELREAGPTSYGDYLIEMGVASPEMGRDVTVKFIDGLGREANIYDPDSEATSTSLSRKVIDWAHKVFNNPKTTEKKRNLTAAMLVYGGYAQVYFKVDADNPVYNILAEYGIAMPDMSQITGDLMTELLNKTTGTKVNYSAQEAFFDSAIYHRVYFKLASTEDPANYKYEVTQRDSKGNVTTIEVEPGYDSDYKEYYADIPNIASPHLDFAFTVTVTNTVTGETYVVQTGPMSWVKSVVTKGTSAAARINLAKSVYYYNQAANVYFGV